MCEISGHIEINISNCTFNYYDAPWPEFKDPYANDRKGGKGGRGGKDGNGNYQFYGPPPQFDEPPPWPDRSEPQAASVAQVVAPAASVPQAAAASSHNPSQDDYVRRNAS